MRTLLTSSAVLLTFAAGAARADDVTTVVAEPAARTAAAGDPNLDRGFLLPTAMTQPAGSITYNNYELFLHGVTVGLTDRIQLSATVLAPIIEDIPLAGLLSLKGQVVTSERFHLALQGTLGGAKEIDHGGGVFEVGAGVLASFCLRQDCSSLLSGTVSYQLLGASGSSEHPGGLVYGMSAVHRVGRHVKLLAEVASVAETRSWDSGALFNYGVRFYSGSIAGDVGFIKPIDAGPDGFLMGLPFASVSYRWQ